jgi:tight adherence protein B
MGDVVAALAGGGVGLGLTLAVAGISHSTTAAFRRPWKRVATRPFRLGRRYAVAAAAGAALWLITGWPVAGLAAAAGVVALPWLMSAGRVTAHRIDRLDALEGWLRHLADLLGAGHLGLISAIQSSAREVSPAIANEVVTLAQRLRIWEVRAALLEFADDVDDRIGDIAAAGLCVVHQQGAGAAELLSSLAQQVAQEVTARRNAEVERARRRSTARVLLGIWALMFLGFALLGSSSYTAAYSTVTGQVVLAMVLLLVASASVWLRRLGIEPQTARFLRDTGVRS